MKLCLTLTKSGTDLNFDFTGTDDADARADQSRAHHHAVELLRRAQAHLPGSAGERRRVPPDQVQHPGRHACSSVKYPTPVGGYLEVGRPPARRRVRRAGAGDPAAHARGVVRHHRRDHGRRTPSAHRALFRGGVSRIRAATAAISGGDGLVHGVTPQSMANFMSIEMSEHRYPVRFRHFALREDSGGAGKFRGGCGTTYCIRAVDGLPRLGARRPRRSCAVRRRGRQVGRAERSASIAAATRSSCRRCAANTRSSRCKAGDLVMNSSPGGGGFGNPLERALESVELDLNLGYISRATAERDYGAVIAEDATRPASRPATASTSRRAKPERGKNQGAAT